jgi:transposase-like protein
MNVRDFEHFVSQLGYLSKRQREHVLTLLSHASQHDKVVAELEGAAVDHLACPRCRGEQYHLHGSAHGLQRYRCVACGKTFNGLTGTPLARLRHKSKWLRYSDCLLSSMTVRASAARVGVHKNTTFRWRHRFLTLPKTDRPLRLGGIAEADEMYLLESEKGARNLDRPPRKRGGAASKRGISDEQVCILVARDRSGKTLDFVTGNGPVTKRQLVRCLHPVMDKDALLVTDSNAAYRYFARDAGITHQAVNLRAGVRVKGAIHVQNVNAYHSRFRGWLERFHGVATHYLPNYLGWRWVLDAKRIASSEALLRATIGSFPHLAVT